MQRLFFLTTVIVCLFLIGCEPPSETPGGAPPATRALVPGLEMEMGAAGPVAPPAAPPAQEKPPAENEKPDVVLVPTGPGMTGKGNYNTGGGQNPTDIITVPVKTLWRAQERILLLNVENAEKLYKATHERLPDTHEAYMRDVLQGITLPSLPPGQKYVYDPKDQELKVQKPR